MLFFFNCINYYFKGGKKGKIDKKDGKTLKKLFDIWRKLNLGLEKYGRKVNIPEVISEGKFCIFSNMVRSTLL